MKTPSRCRLHSWLSLTALLLSVIFLPSLAIAAMAPANQEIFNQATVTYEDSAGNKLSKTSDQARVTVAQVYSSDFGDDYLDLNAVSGQSVNFAHTLQNNGNGVDSYTFSLTDLTTTSSSLNATKAFLSNSLKAYVDDNCNGVRDAGENTDITQAGIPNLGVGDSVCIVVQAQVDPTAINGDKSGYTLTISNPNGGINGDFTSGEVNGLVTVTDVVLDVDKQATLDEVNQTINYVVTLTNNGPGLASHVLLYDALPAVNDNGTSVPTTLAGNYTATTTDTNGSLILPAQNTAQDLSESDIKSNISDVDAVIDFNADGDSIDTNEVQLNIDLNNDGLLDTGPVQGVWAYKSELAPNESITISFTVSYATSPAAFPAGTSIVNIARFVTDNNNDSQTDGAGETGASVPANGSVTTTQATVFDFTLEETVADGDGNAAVVTIDAINYGEIATFSHKITNNGNGPDTFTLNLKDFDADTLGNTCPAWPNGSPAVTFKDDAGNVLTPDTNGIINYTVPAGGSRVFTTELTVPGSAAATGPFCFRVEAVSSGSATQLITDTILAITEPVVAAGIADILLTDTLTTLGSNNGIDDDPATGVASSVNANINEELVFAVSINNETANSASYTLSVDSLLNQVGLDAAFASAKFYLASDLNTVITSTPLIPAAATLDLVVKVQVTSDPALTSNSPYPLFVKIQSNSTANADAIQFAVNIAETEIITLAPDNNGQIGINTEATYIHTVVNAGNTTEAITLTLNNDISNGAFDQSIYGKIDSNNDGTPDTAVTVGTLTNIDLGATTVDVRATLTTLTLTLSPGDSLAFSVRVSSSSSAAEGDIDLTSVEVTWDNGSATVTDTSTVVSVQLDLAKRVALDAACDGTPDEAFSTIGSDAKPGDCLIWQVTVENNSSDQTANNVVVSDQVPDFTMLTTIESLESCSIVVTSQDTLSAACSGGTYCAHTYASDDEACATADADGQVGIINGAINFFIGTGASGSGASGSYNPQSDARSGGQLLPGQGYTVRFRVKVDE